MLLFGVCSCVVVSLNLTFAASDVIWVCRVEGKQWHRANGVMVWKKWSFQALLTFFQVKGYISVHVYDHAVTLLIHVATFNKYNNSVNTFPQEIYCFLHYIFNKNPEHIITSSHSLESLRLD